MTALSDKTVLLVTHQVDFLPVFDSILVPVTPSKMSPYDDICVSMMYFDLYLSLCIF